MSVGCEIFSYAFYDYRGKFLSVFYQCFFFDNVIEIGNVSVFAEWYSYTVLSNVVYFPLAGEITKSGVRLSVI